MHLRSISWKQNVQGPRSQLQSVHLASAGLLAVGFPQQSSTGSGASERVARDWARDYDSNENKSQDSSVEVACGWGFTLSWCTGRQQSRWTAHAGPGRMSTERNGRENILGMEDGAGGGGERSEYLMKKKSFGAVEVVVE